MCCKWISSDEARICACSSAVVASSAAMRASKAALLSLGQALRAYLKDKGVHVMTVMPTTIDTDMAKGADVPKMTTEFVAGEILRHIQEESIDPPIGEEAEGVLARLKADPAGLEEFLSAIRA